MDWQHRKIWKKQGKHILRAIFFLHLNFTPSPLSSWLASVLMCLTRHLKCELWVAAAAACGQDTRRGARDSTIFCQDCCQARIQFHRGCWLDRIMRLSKVSFRWFTDKITNRTMDKRKQFGRGSSNHLFFFPATYQINYREKYEWSEKYSWRIKRHGCQLEFLFDVPVNFDLIRANLIASLDFPKCAGTYPTKLFGDNNICPIRS